MCVENNLFEDPLLPPKGKILFQSPRRQKPTLNQKIGFYTSFIVSAIPLENA